MQGAIESVIRTNELVVLLPKFTQTEKGFAETNKAMKPEIFKETRKNVNSIARSMAKFPELLD